MYTDGITGSVIRKPYDYKLDYRLQEHLSCLGWEEEEEEEGGKVGGRLDDFLWLEPRAT